MADFSHTDFLMPNGNTVGDWLGTVRVNATVAGRRAEELRTSANPFKVSALVEILNELSQAQDELREVVCHERHR
jgi:hypothetical protein